MALVVNTNIGSMNAQRALTQSSLELRSAMERLSSGKKINSAVDDAGATGTLPSSATAGSDQAVTEESLRGE